MEQPDVMDVVDFEEDEGTAAVGGGSSPVARASESQGDDDMNNGANLALHCDGEQGNNGNAAGASADGGATGQVEDGGADVAQGDKVVADDNAATATATTAAVAAPYEYPTGPIKIDQL